MTSKTLAVFIGRFSPLHLGHVKILQRALDTYDHVLVLIGSAEQPRTIKDPFTFHERRLMLRTWQAIKPGKPGSLMISPLLDYPYNDTLWLSEVNKKIDEAALSAGATSLHLIGSDRDNTTYYLKLFPQLKKDLIEQDISTNMTLSATIVRELYFGSMLEGKVVHPATSQMLLRSFLPTSSISFLIDFQKTAEFKQLVNEFKFIAEYKQQWSVAPYAPTFVTVDAVVVQAGHVLVIERKSEPGKGLLALPGGFLEQSESLLTAVLRELKEETKIGLSPMQLKGSIKRKEVFDKPDRSLRGRTITIAYYFELNEVGELPKIKSGSDARSASWKLISSLKRDEMFEDHYHIIETMIGSIV